MTDLFRYFPSSVCLANKLGDSGRTLLSLKLLFILFSRTNSAMTTVERTTATRKIRVPMQRRSFEIRRKRWDGSQNKCQVEERSSKRKLRISNQFYRERSSMGCFWAPVLGRFVVRVFFSRLLGRIADCIERQRLGVMRSTLSKGQLLLLSPFEDDRYDICWLKTDEDSM